MTGPIHNALHRVTALQQAYARALGARDGAFNGIERAGETLTPIIDLWSQPEWAAIRGERLCAWVRGVLGVAAEHVGVALANPAGTNRLVVVEGVSSNMETAGSHELWLLTDAAASAVLTSSSQGASRDRRLGLTSQSVIRYLSIATASKPAGLQIDQRAEVARVQTNFTSLPVVLIPGQAIMAWAGNTNNDFETAWLFRERAALPGELD